MTINHLPEYHSSNLAAFPTRVGEPTFAGRAGVARRDITPPLGIYSRSWGAAPTDVAEGVHRPLTATALALAGSGDGAPVLLVALDLGWFRSAEDELSVRRSVLDALDLDESRVMIAMSHTHAGPSVSTADRDKPGGEKVVPYLESVRAALREAAAEAVEGLAPALLSWTRGHCDLARNRDLDQGDRHACGFNPATEADDTVLVGRVTSERGILATLVNYACHPTTLAWENRLISPDYVGAMREVVEGATGAPCLFLQGASGELGPRQGLTGETAVADANGRMLGHAVLAALEGMLPPGQELVYRGILESGAPLAIWRPEPFDPPGRLAVRRESVVYATRTDEELDAIERTWESLDERVRGERLSRRVHLRRSLPEARAGIGLWVWRVGNAVFVGQPNEAYSTFQTELRRRFPEQALVVMNLVNGPGLGYLPEASAYRFERDLYQVWQTPFARGSLERLLERAERSVAAVLETE